MDDVSPEQMQVAAREALGAITQALIAQRDEWVRHRANSGVDFRMRVCEMLYRGGDVDERAGMADVLQNGPRARSSKVEENPGRSKAKINIVKDKVEQLTSRLQEILLPTDDMNWGMRSTPIPMPSSPEQIAQTAQGPMVDPAGNPVTELQAMRVMRTASEAAARRMQEQIHDDLTECQFNEHSRSAIAAGVLRGTGIVKGPFPRRSVTCSWQRTPGGYVKVENVEIKPSSKEVSAWNVFPDPACGKDIQRGAGIYEMIPATAKELRRLVGVPGFIPSAVEEVLSTKPQKVVVGEAGAVSRIVSEDKSYQMWEYHGEVDPSQMTLLSSMAGDPLNVESGVLVIVNDMVIGALPMLTSDNSLPYDFWCYREVDDTPFGDGMPLDSEDQQRVVNGAWRMAMDAGRSAAGPQVVVRRNQIKPADNNNVLSPFKLWWADDDVEDVQKAFEVYDTGGGLAPILELLRTAIEVNEKETNTPALMQGQTGVSPETLGGQQLAIQQASSPIRMRVKRWDDKVTIPHLTRHFEWQMQNSKRNDIKGDMMTVARGSSVLIEKDIQNQLAMQLLQISADPRFAADFKNRWLLEHMLKGYFKINPEDALETEDVADEKRASTPPPQDPRLQVAQMNMEMKKADLADKQQQRQLDGNIEQANMEERRASLQYNAQREQAEYEIAMTQTQSERDIAFARLANERNMSVEQLMQEWKIKTLELDTKRQVFNAEAALRVQTGAGI